MRLDLFGAANVVGASYDARFKGDSGLGFAVGVGYGFGIGNWYEIHGVGVPVEINYLAGRGKHHFEIGAGMSNGVYFDKITESKTMTLPDGSTGTAPKEVRTTQWGNFLYANVGYRLRAENGLVFRCGLSPSYGIGKYGLSKSVFYPYLSLDIPSKKNHTLTWKSSKKLLIVLPGVRNYTHVKRHLIDI